MLHILTVCFDEKVSNSLSRVVIYENVPHTLQQACVSVSACQTFYNSALYNVTSSLSLLLHVLQEVLNREACLCVAGRSAIVDPANDSTTDSAAGHHR